MRNARFLISFVITVILIFLLNNSWQLGATRIPPLGKFLDPFHGFWQNIEPKGFTGPAELRIEGLKDKVTVVYDSLLIPHIFANNDEDLYLAQGYIHAQNRLWQMEWQTHAGAGRISQLIGPGAGNAVLEYDRSQRRLGMVFAAKNLLKVIEKDPKINSMIEAYTTGVNHFIQSLSYQDLPIEYKLMDYRPEAWTNLKCAQFVKVMCQDLNMGDKDIQMTNALKLFGSNMVDLLYPDNEMVGDPIVNKPGEWNFTSLPLPKDSITLALSTSLMKSEEILKQEDGIGSNNWALSGSKTTLGSPILCSDPHLGLNLPSIWYVVQQHAPGINAMGASFPGVPFIPIGYNDSIAWAATNAERDVIDWFKITFKDNKRDLYLLDGKWVPTQKVIEEITVRGGETFYDTVVYTQWGPVTYDKTFKPENNRSDFAFRWISHDESEDVRAYYLLNRAHNFDDYMKAMDYITSPAQNWAFASVHGDIAIRVQGKFPVRKPKEGKFALDGSRSANGWQQFIPNDQNIMWKNPQRGFISSANQYPADSTYPYYIQTDSYEAFRNRRINSLLTSKEKFSIEEMMQMHEDNYNLKAAEILPHLVSTVSSSNLSVEEKKALDFLSSWDYFNEANSVGASYFEAWWETLYETTWDEMNITNVSLSYPTAYTTIKLIKTQPQLSFFDIRNTDQEEDATQVILLSFKNAVKKIEEWKKTQESETVPWADYKDSSVRHLARLEPFSFHVKHGGNNNIINAHSKRSGPSWRMVASMEKAGVRAWGVYPGGQSGNPGSFYYANMLSHWTEGEHYPLLFIHSPEEAESKSLYSTTINPASK